MTNLKYFQLPPETEEKSDVIPENKLQGFSKKLAAYIQKYSPLNAFSASSGEHVDDLRQIKKVQTASDRINAALTLILFIVLITTWKWGLPMFREIDQLRNDLEEQKQVIQMERSNQVSFKRLENDREKLAKNIQTIDAALPAGDEEAEAVISMLEDMAMSNRMIIDAIGIRLIPESQMNHDELIGYVGVYEYTFSLESELPNILSFITSIRSSMRLMDIMVMEIEEKEDGLYRAGFVLHAYHFFKTNVPEASS